MSNPNLSSAQFDPDDFAERYHSERGDPAWEDPYTAGGRCHIASEDMVAYARKQGHDAGLVERIDTPGFRGEHIAARVHNFMIDPTSAQLEHTDGAAYEIKEFDPKVHLPTKGWYGGVPDTVPKRVNKPKWPANKEWDDLPKAHQDRMVQRNPWIKW